MPNEANVAIGKERARAAKRLLNRKRLGLESAIALGLQLSNLAAKLLCRLGVFGGICHLSLKLCDAYVSLGDCLLPVGAAHLRLLLRRLLPPVVFLGLRLFLRLCTMIITAMSATFRSWPTQKIGPLTL